MLINAINILIHSHTVMLNQIVSPPGMASYPVVHTSKKLISSVLSAATLIFFVKVCKISLCLNWIYVLFWLGTVVYRYAYLTKAK